jgi:uncharacterized membrane protein YccC
VRNTGRAVHRATRVAIVGPSAFALCFLVFRDSQMATFAAFGCFALLLFVEFAGHWRDRLLNYLVLALTGLVLIPLGTLASTIPWLAVASMTIVAMVVLFAGASSASVAAAARSVLLLYILPVTFPGAAMDIPSRLAGWGIAVVVAIPVAMLVWPLREQYQLQQLSAACCDAIADVAERFDASVGEDREQLRDKVSENLDRLHRAFRGTAVRPLRITHSSRALLRLVEELGWLGRDILELTAERVSPDPVFGPGDRTAIQTLRSSADVLRRHYDARMPPDDELPSALDALDADQCRASDAARRQIEGADDPDFGVLFLSHQFGYASTVIGTTALTVSGAERTSSLSGAPPAIPAQPLSPTWQVLGSYLSPQSVFLRNAIRGGLGLGLAVLVVEVAQPQHGFWVALGALSVLRSNAALTGSTAIRAFVGSLAGFAIGAAIVLLIGTSTPILWILYPCAVFVGALSPELISFTAGQAGFTVVLIVLFNIISPVGWQVGVTRIEDVALGCASSLVVAVLLWPRGASNAIRRAISDSFLAGGRYLDASVGSTVTGAPLIPKLQRDALAAGRRLDDAVRQFVAERGQTNLPTIQFADLASVAISLRLSADAIRALRGERGPGDGSPAAEQAQVAGVLDDASSVCSWYETVARVIVSRHSVSELVVTSGSSSVRTLAHAAAHRDPDGSTRESNVEFLLWVSLYVRDAKRHERNVVTQLTALERNPSGRRPAAGEGETR